MKKVFKKTKNFLARFKRNCYLCNKIAKLTLVDDPFERRKFIKIPSRQTQQLATVDVSKMRRTECA